MYKYQTGIENIDTKVGGLNPGTNILILAPAFSNAEQVATYLAKPRKGEYMIVLTTENQATDLLDYFKGNGFDPDYIGIIDAITRSSSALTPDSHKVKYVGSPNDLTGMDIRFSQLTEEIMKGEFTDDPNQLFPTPIRYCVLSLTSMLMFRKIDTIYQFLHVVTSKLKKMGSIGIFLINSETFDPKTVAIVKQLMNVVVEIKNDENGPALRIQGTMGLSMNWRQFDMNNGELIFPS
jgi:Fe-S-cluster formation regulator IscX/YfhJ